MFELHELSRFLGRRLACYRFVRGNLVQRYTSADREVVVDGETFVSARGIKHSAIRESAGSSKKNELTITMPFLLDPAATGPLPATQALGVWWRPYPPSQRVFVDILSYHFGDDDAELQLDWSGRVLAPSFKDLEMTLTCDPSRSNSRTSGRAKRISRNCGVALYSQGYGQCNLDPERIPVQATVVAIEGDEVTIELSGEPPRPLAPGPIEWLDTDEEPKAAAVLAVDGDVLTLDDASALAVDDVVTVYTTHLWVPATLSAASGLTLTAAAFGTSPFGMEGGFIRWTRDNGLVESRNVLAHLGTSITVDYGAPDFAPGLAVRAYWGCPHNLAACEARGNAIHYPGFKYLPTEDPMGRSQAWG